MKIRTKYLTLHLIMPSVIMLGIFLLSGVTFDAMIRLGIGIFVGIALLTFVSYSLFKHFDGIGFYEEDSA